MKRVNIFALAITLFFVTSLDTYAMGKKFSEQGDRLSFALNNLLVSKGFCKSPPECFDLLPGYTDHDDMVRINYYEVGDKNFAAFLEVINFALKSGMATTGNVPISIKAYRETHDQVRKSGLFVKDIKPFMSMEVTK